VGQSAVHGADESDNRCLLSTAKKPLRSNGELEQNAPTFHTSKPDRDNVDKAILDALVSCGVLSDDKIVCGGQIWKRYDSVPRVEILISKMES